MVLGINLVGDELLTALRTTPANEYLVVNPDGSYAGVLASKDLVAQLTGPAA